MKAKIISIISHPVISGSAILVVGSMGVNVINLIYQVIMANTLKSVLYGELISLYSILYILSIVPLSTSVAIVKFISSAKNARERLVIYIAIKKLVFWIAVVLSIAVVFLSYPIAQFLHIPDVLSVVFTAGVLFFSLITLVNQSTSQGVLKFMGVVVPNFVSSVTKLILGIILFYLGLSVGGVMFAVVIGVAAAYLISTLYVKDRFKGTSAKKYDLTKFFKYSAPVLLQALAFTSFFTTDVILVKHFFSATDAGIYGVLSTLGKIVFFAASPVASAMFPFVAGKKSKGEKYFKILIGSLVATALVSVGIVGIYYLFPGLIFKILYPHYLVAQYDLAWMGLFIAFYTMSSFLINFFLSVDKTWTISLPLFFAVLQIIGIWFYHGSLLTVIQISLVLSFALFILLLGYLVYNRAEHV